MSFPNKEDLDLLLRQAKAEPNATWISVRVDWLVYLIENLRRVNDEVRELADQHDELHDDYNKQLRRVKKWKRRYTALVNKEQPSE